ncbi:MAG: hypothetical protein ACKVVP_23915 [Chloroflexota bacterium]
MERSPDLEANDVQLQNELQTHEPDLVDLAPDSAARIRLFLADRVVKGGASPADIAALYTAPAIVDDALATRYLDRQFVNLEIPVDWRALQERVSAAFARLPLGATSAEVLAGLDAEDYFEHRERSIFDDPDDAEDDLYQVLSDQDPTLVDLASASRRAIERIIVHEALANGIPPVRYMELRESFHAIGDERALQYLDLPYDRGERPADWDELRDQSLRIRQRSDSRDFDPLNVLLELEIQFPELESAALLRLLNQRLD